MRARLGPALLGLLAGAVAGGTGGAAAGALVGTAWPSIVRVRARRARAHRLEEQVPDLLRILAAAVRAGRNLHQALAAAAEETEEPIREPLARATERLRAGTPVDEVLDRLALECSTPAATSAVETLRIARAAGSNLPAVLDAAVEGLAERARIARDRRAATAQARLSAAIVGGMPLAFFAMAGSGARAQMTSLLAEPVGWVIVGGGLLLEAAGVAWMRAVTKPS